MTYTFTLPFKLESLNTFSGYSGGRKIHWFKQKIGEHLFPQVNNAKIKGLPFERVRIKVVCYRRRLIEDVQDNLPASLKPLLDALQPPIKCKPSKRFPDGLKATYRVGVIANDNPDCIIELDYKQFKDWNNQKTEIQITDVRSIKEM